MRIMAIMLLMVFLTQVLLKPKIAALSFSVIQMTQDKIQHNNHINPLYISL